MIKLDEQTERLLLGYLEGDLDEAERWRAEAELTRRPELARWVRAMRDDREALRGATPEVVPESVRETVDALREREALLGDAPPSGGRRSGGAVVGRIGPSGAGPRAGDRSLRTRRWVVRLAAAAAVLLCAAVMVQSIIGTNLLRSAIPGAAGVEELAMDTPPGPVRQRAAEPEMFAFRELDTEDDPLPAPEIAVSGGAEPSAAPAESMDAERMDDAGFLAESALESAETTDSLAVATPLALSPETAALAPSEMPAIGESDAEPEGVARLGAVTQPGSGSTRAGELDGDTLASALARNTAREERSVVDRLADAPVRGMNMAGQVGEDAQADAAEPALRVEVDTLDQVAAYTDLQRWALSNSVVVRSASPAGRHLGDVPDQDALGPETTPDAFNARLLERVAQATAGSDEVQVVQLAVPADRVDALLTYLNDDGRQPVRLLSEGNDVAAGRGMSIDRHPQVDWVPAGSAQADGALTVTDERRESWDHAAAGSDGLMKAQPGLRRDGQEAAKLAGVDLAAMLRVQAPTVATRSLVDLLPEPAVNVELLLRQQPEAASRPAATPAPQPANPAEPDDGVGDR